MNCLGVQILLRYWDELVLKFSVNCIMLGNKEVYLINDKSRDFGEDTCKQTHYINKDDQRKETETTFSETKRLIKEKFKSEKEVRYPHDSQNSYDNKHQILLHPEVLRIFFIAFTIHNKIKAITP